ncbi:MAG: TRAP transporter small permease subunit [Acidobacteria bacterium]|nr:TRAP transporter small permease subunit [Acidobacteriota bacterium]
MDRTTHWIGQFNSFLCLAMVLIGAFNALARKLGHSFGLNLSSNAYLEIQWYLFSILFLLGASYTLKADEHVRVDVFYTRLNPRQKAWLNLLGHLFFLIPFALVMIWLSWPMVMASWNVLEQSPDPGGLPRYPIKTLILVAFILFGLQGLSEAFKSIRRLRHKEAA